MIQTIDSEIAETQRKLTEKNREAAELHRRLEALELLKAPISLSFSAYLSGGSASISRSHDCYMGRSSIDLTFAGCEGVRRVDVRLDSVKMEDLQKFEDRFRRGPSRFGFSLQEIR